MPILIWGLGAWSRESGTTSALECAVPTALDVRWHQGSKSPAPDSRLLAPAVEFETRCLGASRIDGSTPESRLAAHSRTTARSTSRRPPDTRFHRVPPRPG